MQNSVTSLYTGKKNQNLKFFKLPFMIDPKSEILGINLAKYVQDIYKENYKILMKGVNEELYTWEDIPCL